MIDLSRYKVVYVHKIDAFPDTVKIIKVDDYYTHYVDLQNNKHELRTSVFKKFFYTYDEMCSYILKDARDGYPYDRIYELIVRKDKIDNPEKYL
jgi:hypothetical protein